MIDWISILFTLIGGLALFLYGMNLMSEGINKSAGRKIRKMLEIFTQNRFKSLLTGTIATAILQSSTAVSVMVISLVKARILRFPQTFGLLLGAGIGTTITAQIIAFKITDYALLIIAIGFFLGISTKNNFIKMAGTSLIGFGLLFYGLHLMSESMYPLREYQPFIDLLTRLDNPVTGVIAGMLFTLLIQSSSAFIGIVIVLASQGLINLEAGVALLLGSNIGTTGTAIIASINAGYESKRVALAFFMIKLIGVLSIVWWIPQYAVLIKQFTSGADVSATAIPRQIANAHTVFNLWVTIILLPLTHYISKWIMKIIPPKEEREKGPVQVQYLNDQLISSPPLALTVAKKETLRMAGFVHEMMKKTMEPFLDKSDSGLNLIAVNEEKVDYLRIKIAEYVTKVSLGQIPKEMAKEAFRIHYIISELEQIADIMSGELSEKAREWMESDMEFSEEGKKELTEFHLITLEQFEKTRIVIESLDRKEAGNLKAQHKKSRQLADDLKKRHFDRLANNVQQSVSSSKVHMELMGALRIVHSHFGNIVRIIAG